jgi:translation initiation factor 1 (eIF-1/SUI1)
MTKIPVRIAKKRKPKVVENIHSINNQEFRFPSLLTRLKNLWTHWAL